MIVDRIRKLKPSYKDGALDPVFLVRTTKGRKSVRSAFPRDVRSPHYSRFGLVWVVHSEFALFVSCVNTVVMIWLEYQQIQNNYIDETGQKYGRLVVLGEDGYYNNEICWKCRCDCGNEVTVRGISLRKRVSTSCGCFHREQLAQRNAASKNPQKAEFAKKASSLREQGLSYQAIADTFDREGVPTLKDGKKWHGSTIKWLLKED